ncbi:hypothetical protein NPIL_99161, partial [Nephila pilipes]
LWYATYQAQHHLANVRASPLPAHAARSHVRACAMPSSAANRLAFPLSCLKDSSTPACIWYSATSLHLLYTSKASRHAQAPKYWRAANAAKRRFSW